VAGGRLSKLTDDLQKRLCGAIAAGNYRQPACKSVGIDYSTFLRWMQKGKRAKGGQFREFRSAVLKAEAEAEVRTVAQWQKHMPESPQECRHFLARRYPQRWGVTTRHEGTAREGVPRRVGTGVRAEDMTDKELHARVNGLLGLPPRPAARPSAGEEAPVE
jgi:hypothetical protein